MVRPPHKTAVYRIIQDGGGQRFCFFCALSRAAICTTKAVPQEFSANALDYAWETEGRSHFNLCHRCGKWVSDVMYNADTLECVDCSPWEEQPTFCPNCGAKVVSDKVFCHGCGCRLKYGGEDEIHGNTHGPCPRTP